MFRLGKSDRARLTQVEGALIALNRRMRSMAQGQADAHAALAELQRTVSNIQAEQDARLNALIAAHESGDDAAWDAEARALRELNSRLSNIQPSTSTRPVGDPTAIPPNDAGAAQSRDADGTPL